MKISKSVKAEKVKDYEVGKIVLKSGKILTLKKKDSEEYGEKILMTIKSADEVKSFFANQTSLDILIDAFGDETDDWIGEKVFVIVEKSGNNQPMFMIKPFKE